MSAVGHEIDVTLTDFAADHRAATPSAAAEAVVPVLADVVERLQELTVRTAQAMARYCLFEQRRLDTNIIGLAQIRFRIQDESQRTDEAADRLKNLVCQRVIANRELVRNRQRELAGLNPMVMIKRGLAMIPQLMKRLERQIVVLSERRRRQIEATASQLTQLSPLAILGRGYSILTKVRDGTIVRRAEDTHAGEEIVARLSEGQLGCTVKHVLPDPSV